MEDLQVRRRGQSRSSTPTIFINNNSIHDNNTNSATITTTTTTKNQMGSRIDMIHYNTFEKHFQKHTKNNTAINESITTKNRSSDIELIDLNNGCNSSPFIINSNAEIMTGTGSTNTRIYDSSFISSMKSKSQNISYDSIADNEFISRESLIKKIKNCDFSENYAYQVYRFVGDYWRIYPKTDYTYSRLSKHRIELKPGIVAMPNMSRHGLRPHEERMNDNIHKFQSEKGSFLKFYQGLRFFNTSKKSRLREYLSYAYTKLLLLLSGILHYIFSFIWIQNNNKNYQTYSTVKHQKGIFNYIKSTIKSFIYGLTSTMYSIITFILLKNLRIFKSAYDDERNRKILYVILFMLLPLLLFSGSNYSEYNVGHLLQRYTSYLMNNVPNTVSNTVSNTVTSFTFPILTLPYYLLTTIRSSSTSFLSSLSSTLLSTDVNVNNKKIIDENFLKEKNYNLKKNEYDNLINSINDYIQKSIDNKLIEERIKMKDEIKFYIDNQQLTDKLTQIIANTVHENIINIYPKLIYDINEQQNEQQKNMMIKTTTTTTTNNNNNNKYELNDADIERIIESLRIRLNQDDTFQKNLFILNDENLKKITNIIKLNFETMNMNTNNIENNILKKININNIFEKILNSTNLIDLIDKKILKQLNYNENDQKLFNEKSNNMMNEINININELHKKLIKYENEKNHLKNLYDTMNNKQNEIIDKINLYENDITIKTNNIINDFNEKIQNINDAQLNTIIKEIKIYIIKIFDINDNNNNNNNIDLNSNSNINIDYIKNLIKNKHITKDYLEEKLYELNNKLNEQFKNDFDNSKKILITDIMNKMKIELIKIIDEKQQKYYLNNQNLNENQIKNMINDAFELYNADKTGLVDYALESGGGQVLSTRCTENYHTKSAQISIFGIPLWYPSNTPRIAIAPAVQPGECWAFQGFPGFLVLKLSNMVYVTGFTIEHIPKSLSPNGQIDSAPKKFTVWGLHDENDQEPALFGEYEYLHDSTALQYFPVLNTNINRPYDTVELRIESNHGNLQYTCLYRFRVHGKATN